METTELMETAGPSTIPADRAELTVGEVARDSGVSASAVRFYEKHAVVTADRTAGNQRRFGDAAVCRIQVARLAQRVGLTVREIAELFAALPSEPGPEDWEQVSERLVAEAEQRITNLRTQLESLGSDGRLCDQ